MIRIVRAEIYKYTKSNIMKIMTLVALIYALVQCLSLISVLYVNIGAIEANQIISEIYNNVEKNDCKVDQINNEYIIHLS